MSSRIVDIANYGLTFCDSCDNIVVAILANMHVECTILATIYPLNIQCTLCCRADAEDRDILLGGKVVILEVGLVDTLEDIATIDVD